MVEKFGKILSEFESANQEINLFALLKMDDLVDKWSVIIAADWFSDTGDNKEIFVSLFHIIESNLSDEEFETIARFGVFSVGEHLIQELLKFKEGAVVENQQINGNMIYKGYIIKSNSNIK